MSWVIVDRPRSSCGTSVAGRPLPLLERLAPAIRFAAALGFDTLRLGEPQYGLGPRDNHLAVDELNTGHAAPPCVWDA
jgi:hypothetical protein